MTQPLISILDHSQYTQIKQVLTENGLENRSEFIQKNNLNKTKLIDALETYGYRGEMIDFVVNEIMAGKTALLVYDDYEDLPGVFEILNSYGFDIIDTYADDTELMAAYHVGKGTGDIKDMEDCKEDEISIPISIPAHFVQDPYEDQL